MSRIAASSEGFSRTPRSRNRALLPLAATVTIVLLMGIAILEWISRGEIESPATIGAALRDLVRAGLAALGRLPPIAFFGAMAFLCIMPVPVSAFYLTGAAVYGASTALWWIVGALAVNIFVSQTIASRWLRPVAIRLLEVRGLAVPVADLGRDEIGFIVLVRLTPGVPFFAQNLVLGLANVDLVRSLAISLPIQMLFAGGFVLLGRSAFEGRLGTATAAIGLIVSVSIVARFLHRKITARRAR